MKNTLILLFLVLSLGASAQNYRPDGRAFVSVNGHHKYTRALYGGPTEWRLETSDRPVFAIYKKRDSRHVQFFVDDTPLDALDYCEARHWNGWAVSQNIIKIIPANDDIAGYIYAYLNCEYANILIKRETYGAVVDMIDDNNVSSIPIPILKNGNKQNEINNLVLEANTLRYHAYIKEQEAISIMNDVLTNR